MKVRRGFTLLEMLAVVTILALVAMMVMPGIGRVGAGDLDEEARRLAASLELARHRAVATGARHRLWLDVESGAWRVEWHVSEARALGEPETQEARFTLASDAPIPMEAPRRRGLDWHPVPNELGRATALEGDVLFEGVETPSGWLERGDAAVVFEPDGSAEPASIRLSAADGRMVLVEVRALADAVRVIREVL